MATNLMTLGYIYNIHRLNNTPDIISTLTHLVRIVTWTPLMLAWDLILQGRYQYQNCLSPSTEFTGTENQEVPTAFYTSTQFILKYSGFNRSINPYLKIYIYNKLLDLGEGT